MPLNGQFIQMISALSEIKARNRQLDLQEKQYNTAIKQYEEEHHDKDKTDLINRLVASTAESRAALLGMEAKNFSPEEMSYFKQFAAAQPVDPRLLSAESVGRGVTAMSGTPLQALADREAALRNNTGGGVGALQSSNFQGGLMAGQPSPDQVKMAQDRLASGMDPQALAIMQSQQTQGLVPRQAQIQAGTALSEPQIASNALQARGLGIQAQQATNQADYWQSQAQLGWAHLRQEDRKLAQEYGLEMMMGKNGKGIGGMNMKDMIEAQNGLAKLIIDMTSPNTDARARGKLIDLFNVQVGTLGLDSILRINDPNEAPGKVGLLRKWLGDQGLGAASMPPQGPPVTAPPGGNPMGVQMQQPQPQNPYQNFIGMPSFPGYVPSPSPFIMRPNP